VITDDLAGEGLLDTAYCMTDVVGLYHIHCLVCRYLFAVPVAAEPYIRTQLQ
jgi:hypothetical protein